MVPPMFVRFDLSVEDLLIVKDWLNPNPKPETSGIQGLLGGPWDLVTTYNWDYTPTSIWGNPYMPI